MARLRPGDIAVLDHRDLDRLSAEALVRGGVGGCVVNVAESMTGRYPNEGPWALAEHGVHLVDAPGAPLFDLVADGDPIAVAGGAVVRDGQVLAEGSVVDGPRVAAGLAAGRRALPHALEAFVANTAARLGAEGEVLTERLPVPPLRTRFVGRPALVVARGRRDREDLDALGPLLAAERPVLVGVDGGADSLLEAGLTPEVIVGDMDSASERALRCGAELVVHAYRDGRAPGVERLLALGLELVTFPAPGTSEDAALLLTAEAGSAPILSVGTSYDLVELLDRGRAGMASSLLVRLRLGERLIDARDIDGAVGRASVAARSAAAPCVRLAR